MAVIHECDRCGDLIRRPEDLFALVYWFGGALETHLDLCECCKSDVEAELRPISEKASRVPD